MAEAEQAPTKLDPACLEMFHRNGYNLVHIPKARLTDLFRYCAEVIDPVTDKDWIRRGWIGHYRPENHEGEGLYIMLDQSLSDDNITGWKTQTGETLPIVLTESPFHFTKE